MKFLEIENRKGKLSLNDGINKESADKLIDELAKLYGQGAVDIKMCIGEVVCVAEKALETVEVEINSPGGSVFEGQRIYGALRDISRRGVEVITTVNGLAASMGSVILMAGDKRKMTKGSQIMIHEASTIAQGDARSLRKTSDLLESISDEIADIYSERTGGDKKDLRNLMMAETWMTSAQAKEIGFIHEIITDQKFDTEANNNMSILAKLFPDNDQVFQLEASLQEVDSLRSDLTEAQKQLAEFQPLAETNAAISAELLVSAEKIVDLVAVVEAKDLEIAALKEASEVSEDKISVRASELLAQQGSPTPVALNDEAEAPVDLIKVLNSLDGSARTKFYSENESEIRKQLSK